MKIEDVYSLSPLQEGFYYHWLSSPQAYIEQISYQLKGALQLDVLEKSYQLLTARHAMMRTCFVDDFGQGLLQVVQKEVTPAFEYLDVSAEESFSVTDFKEQERHKGFNLRKGSQMRLTVLGLGNNKYEFIWSHHHILMDGWCIGILIKEFFQIYYSLIKGKAPGLGKVHPYASYIKWLQEVDKAPSLSYWRDYLAGYDTISGLAVPRENTGYQVAKKEFALDRVLRRSIKAFCENTGITESVFVQAIWGLLLGRYNNTDDVVFGMVVSGRPGEITGIEEMIGLFINTIPVRIQVSEGATAIEVLQQVQRMSIEGLGHHYTQLAEIQAQSSLGRDLFDHILVFENLPVQDVVAKGMDANQSGEELSVLSTASYDQTNYDFTMTVMPADDLLIIFNYNELIYNEAFITRLLDHFSNMVARVLEAPAAPVQQLDYLSDKEKETLLITFNGVEQELAANDSVLELFTEQVRSQRDKTALVFEDTQLTYKELDERSGQLAEYLIKQYDVQVNDLIGIMMDRSEKMIIGILGILKAGCAYVPIEPEYPRARKEFIINDTGIKVLLTQSDYIFNLEYYSGATFAMDIQLNELPADTYTVTANANDLAYVIYTSGSTGNPKGVLITHGNLLHSTSPRLQVYKDVDKFLLLSSIAFDSSVAGIFGTLCAGGALCITSKIDVGNVDRIADYIINNQVSHLLTVPSYYQLLCAALHDKENDLKQVVVAGEACTTQLVEAHFSAAALKDCDLFNEYGPTEATVWSTVHQYDRKQPVTATIGKPVANTKVYILDKAGKLVPVGVTGEICIAGDGLAKGYLNQPALTAEKFTTHPFEAGERIYKTGDLGKWLPDGSIAFAGRKDDQVKIRGYRVELGEIENALQTHPEIAFTSVLAFNDDSGIMLAAYIVSETALDVKGIQAYLGNLLPAHAIPAYYVQLDALPLTANGKIDRKKLPDPRQSAMASGITYVPPRDEIETNLVAVFEDVLKRERIGVKDDFFSLGGDSIKSIQIVSRLKQRGYTLAIQEVLLYPIVEELATHMQLINRSSDQETVAGEIPLSPVQHWFFDNITTRQHHYNQSVLLYSKNSLSEEGIRLALNKLMQHHDALRMVYRSSGGRWIQENKGVTQGYGWELIEVADEAAFKTACDRIQSGIDLGTGPLFRAALFRSEDGDRLLLVCHHLVIDGVSWRIIFEDLSTLYRQYLNGETLSLPLKTDSFRYWQEKQLAYASSDKLQKEAAYWSDIESADIAPIPQDHPEGGNNLADVRVASFLLNENTSTRLLTQTHQAYRTEINDILVAGLSLALAEIFGLDKILIQLEGHGREAIDAEVDVTRTVGWFTTLYPVLLDMQHQGDVIRQLIAVKEILHRVPNKGIGYGILRYLSGKDYRLTPQVTFNYLGDFGSGIKTSEGNPLFEFSSEYHGREIPENMERHTILDVSGMMVDSKIQLMVNYSTQQYDDTTIQRLLTAYERHLHVLIETLAQTRKIHLTPVDLTYKGLSVSQLQQMNKVFDIEDVYILSR